MSGQRRGRAPGHRVRRDAQRTRRVAGRPAAAGPGRRPRAAHAADEPAHEPRRAPPPPRPRSGDPAQGARRPPRRGRGARRAGRGGRRPRPGRGRRHARRRGSSSGGSPARSPSGPSAATAASWSSPPTSPPSRPPCPPSSGRCRTSSTTRPSSTRRVARSRWSSTPARSPCSTGGPGSRRVTRTAVFDRFYRAEGARSRPGSGLGLSIVRDVAVRNGGSVIARAAARRGRGRRVPAARGAVSGDGSGAVARSSGVVPLRRREHLRRRAGRVRARR